MFSFWGCLVGFLVVFEWRNAVMFDTPMCLSLTDFVFIDGYVE